MQQQIFGKSGKLKAKIPRKQFNFSTTKEKIILVGGGHCKSCIDVIEQTGVFQIAGIVDTWR